MIVRRTRPAFDAMIDTAAKWYGVQPYYIRGACKRPMAVRARDMVTWNARKSGYSLTEIAEALNKHHTTILSNCKRMGL